MAKFEQIHRFRPSRTNLNCYQAALHYLSQTTSPHKMRTLPRSSLPRPTRSSTRKPDCLVYLVQTYKPTTLSFTYLPHISTPSVSHIQSKLQCIHSKVIWARNDSLNHDSLHNINLLFISSEQQTYHNTTMIIQQRHFPVCPSVSMGTLCEYNKLKGLTWVPTCL